jgi:hypothetical protein
LYIGSRCVRISIRFADIWTLARLGVDVSRYRDREERRGIGDGRQPQRPDTGCAGPYHPPWP